MDQLDFYRALKRHCIQESDCTKCCMRLYCYTPPCEQTDSMMEKVIAFLDDSQQIHKVSDSCSDHCTSVRQMPCPCSLDMSTAIGCESHTKEKERETHGKVRVNYPFRFRMKRYRLPNGLYMHHVEIEGSERRNPYA